MLTTLLAAGVFGETPTPTPSDEPVTLSMARAQCSIDDADTSFDVLLTAYIAAARDWVERYTGHIIKRRTIEETIAGFPSGRWIELTYRPIVTVDGIDYSDETGAVQSFEDFTAMLGRYPVRIFEGPGIAWPSTISNSGVTVRYVAGYADDEAPAGLVQAMLLLIGHWFNQRESVAIGLTVAEVPFATRALCDAYRVPWL